jgi:hypothetical protein
MRAPSVVVMMLAVTPGLFGAELMAEAIPCSVLSVESMLIGAVRPPTVIFSVPVPTVEVALATGPDDSDAAVAMFFTAIEYCPATAPEVAVAVAMVLSATVAVKPASAAGSSMLASVLCSVSRALVNVPKAEMLESSLVCCDWIWLFCAAPKAVVRTETMAPMLRPEPMPCDVTRELAADAAEVLALPLDVVVVVGVVVDEIVELMGSFPLSA